MKYSEFIERVQDEADLSTREEAKAATTAVLETLGERLYRTERRKLAAQLPDRLKEILGRRLQEVDRQRIERFGLEEFYKRVSARLDVGYEHGVDRSKAVIAVLREAVSPGEIEDVLGEVAPEYRELFVA